MQAAEARERWREDQGALSFHMPEAKVRVVQPHSPDSSVQIHASQNSGSGQASQQLVSEMMILAGQAIAAIGWLSMIYTACALLVRLQELCIFSMASIKQRRSLRPHCMS